MTDIFSQNENPTHNQPEMTVTQLSSLLKRTVEDAFSYIRIRGEISSLKKAASGHIYLNLKDDSSTLNAIIWKGVASKLSLTPEDGIEVICTGKITTYGARSNYQMVIETMELAGKGALMALLEKRKQQFIQEGLFEPDRKQPLPYLPTTIGVVTSPTGAVIRDILHRISDRFPVHILLWPVSVQGNTAKHDIAAAIEGFNHLPQTGHIPKPDILIVARGGGSLEDLWAFNEEEVVRAVAASKLPIISAVGHETDTTLIDFAADKRAPTPTAAAEMAVPVRQDLQLTLLDYDKRLLGRIHQFLEDKRIHIDALSRAIASPEQFINTQLQRLDDWSERLSQSLPNIIEHKERDFNHLQTRLSPHIITQFIARKRDYLHALSLPSPKDKLQHYADRIEHLTNQLDHYFTAKLKQSEHQLQLSSQKLSPSLVTVKIEQTIQSLTLQAKLLDSYHYKKVLERGYALIWDDNGQHISSANSLQKQTYFTVEYADGKVDATPKHADEPPSTRALQTSSPRKKRNATPHDNGNQGSLF